MNYKTVCFGEIQFSRKPFREKLRMRYIWLLFVFCFIGCSNPPADPTPEKELVIEVKRDTSFKDQEAEVHKSFADYIEENPFEAINEYNKRFGNVVNTDLARELSKDYNINNVKHGDLPNPILNAKEKAERTKWAKAVYSPSSALSKAIYENMLERDTVVFTAGGAGSGKSTTIKTDEELKPVLLKAQIIVDSTLAGEKGAIENINLALANGKKVHIVYVYREPHIAFKSMLDRAKDEGRTVKIEGFLNTHLGAPKVVERISELFPQDKIDKHNVAIDILDNSFDPGKATPLELETLLEKTKDLNHEKLKDDLISILSSELNKGNITQDIHDSVLH